MKKIFIICLMTCMCGTVCGNSYVKELESLRNSIEHDSVHALHYAESLLKKDKKNPDLAAAIGKLFLRVGRISDAEHFYDKGYHMYRISPSIINLAGDIAYAKNDFKTAEYYYSRAMYFDKRAPEGYFKYARLYSGKDVEKAVQKLKILRWYYNPVRVDLKIADIYHENSKYAQAAEVYATLPMDSMAKDELTNYALSYYFQQKFDSALAVTEKAIERFPRHPAFNRMLLYNNTELKNYDTALTAADKLFHHSDHPTFQYLDYIYYGYALNGKGNYDLAIQQFVKVLELNENRNDALKAISEAYEKIDDYSNAITYYQQYLEKIDEADRTAFKVYHLGKLYYAKGTDKKNGKELNAEKEEALHQADICFQKVEQMRPDSYLGTYWRARTHVALDPETEKGLAKPYYLKVINLLGSNGESTAQLMESYKYLAYYYYRKHDKDSCLIYVDKIMEIDPMDNYAQRLSSAL